MDLALIAGSDNFVAPKATLDAIIPAFNYFAFWYVLGAAAFWYIGIESAAARSMRSMRRCPRLDHRPLAFGRLAFHVRVRAARRVRAERRVRAARRVRTLTRRFALRMRVLAVQY
jgi:hypothetical protein